MYIGVYSIHCYRRMLILQRVSLHIARSLLLYQISMAISCDVNIAPKNFRVFDGRGIRTPLFLLAQSVLKSPRFVRGFGILIVFRTYDANVKFLSSP